MLPRRFDTLLQGFPWTLFTWNLQPRGNSTFSRNVIMRQVQPNSQKWGEATSGQWHAVAVTNSCQSQLLTLLLVQVWRWASPSSSLQMPGPSYSWRASQPGLPELHKDSTNSIDLGNWKQNACLCKIRMKCTKPQETEDSAILWVKRTRSKARPPKSPIAFDAKFASLPSKWRPFSCTYSKRHTNNIRTNYKHHKKYTWKNMLA